MNSKTIIIVPLTILLLLAMSCKKQITAPVSVQQFTIQSTSNPGTYDIKVALPENYDVNKKYSTVYLLDGKDNFDFVAYHCKKMSDKYAKEHVIVVSIGYGHNRTMDYTPTSAPEGQGGAPAFMDFIQKQLIPRMESDFAVDTNRNGRMILGHSFGGLFAAYAFTKHNSVFGNYLMLSPSLWYDDEILFQYEQDNRESINKKKQLVFLGIGQLENAGRMQAPFQAFHSRLNSYYSNMKVLKNSVSQLDHVGSKNPNIIMGLDFYFQNK
jgi:predicted alpha/beta superfamily hydrolase